ncbi:MAG: hypothetical protein F8N36_12075 [Desulfovibrio sp.]|uniref:hypothetical protein n=1 Tax=Desulfovibrio sp. TaxID=885 RepID=UPI00135E2CCE|nr:hypothetical protein [Desulfovibrio sp.]MTJ93585.1 hypothetical protein [Desulfovibrio sp.]
MAKHIGLVIFPDGDRRYFIYNGFCDQAWPELFGTRPQAEAAWDAYDRDHYDPFAVDTGVAADEEPVALYAWDDEVDKGSAPDFYTKASRLAGVITGPRTLEEVVDEVAAEQAFRESAVGRGSGGGLPRPAVVPPPTEPERSHYEPHDHQLAGASLTEIAQQIQDLNARGAERFRFARSVEPGPVCYEAMKEARECFEQADHLKQKTS